MGTLLLRLAAPMQSWGTDSKFETRTTGREPSKSGVVGLLAAALGYRRDSDLTALNALRFGVRVDQEGELLHDFHTAYNPKKPDVEPPYVTHRYYLSDAVFLAGLESGDAAFLETLDHALRHPAFPLFLGRRSCPPSMPLALGIREADLLSALREEPWQAADWRQRRLPATLRLVTDALPRETGGGNVRDRALTFNPAHRQFGWRRAVLRETVRASSVQETGAVQETEHDAMGELRGGE